MVLADDNFASIAHAVEEGRTVYGNLKKAIVFILPTKRRFYGDFILNGESIMADVAAQYGLPLPPEMSALTAGGVYHQEAARRTRRRRPRPSGQTGIRGARDRRRPHQAGRPENSDSSGGRTLIPQQSGAPDRKTGCASGSPFTK